MLAASGAGRVDPRLRARIVSELHDLLADRGVRPQRTRLVLRATQLLLRRGITIRADGTAFVVTGDIPAMWLRDSAAQVAPLLALADAVPAVVELVTSVLRSQVGQVGIDPRANAFNPEPNGMAIRRDFAGQSPWVFERKYAVDSLCAPLTLAWRLWQATGSLAHVDDGFQRMVRTIVSLWRLEQEHDADGFVLHRRLARRDDSLSNGGRGAPVGRTGMTWSGFRPSDDACRFGYHVPANAAASVALMRTADLLDLAGARALAAEARRLGGEIRQGILAHAVVDLPGHGRGFAYEVDGLGHALLLDDANVPSLVSLPYLGFCAPDDPLYRATRSWALGPGDPAWGTGRVAQGIGSTHTRPGWPWPLGILVEGLTAVDPDAVESALRRAEATVQRDGLFHESVHPDDPRRFTRRWFGWADMLHMELVLRSAGLRC
jgi:meiotically up-regulated gene 157 (Mug157) protein